MLWKGKSDINRPESAVTLGVEGFPDTKTWGNKLICDADTVVFHGQNRLVHKQMGRLLHYHFSWLNMMIHCAGFTGTFIQSERHFSPLKFICVKKQTQRAQLLKIQDSFVGPTAVWKHYDEARYDTTPTCSAGSSLIWSRAGLKEF